MQFCRPLEIRGGKENSETTEVLFPGDTQQLNCSCSIEKVLIGLLSESIANLCAEKCKSYLDLGITLALFLWPSLTLAVNSNWGGPESPAKREWFASTTIDLITENPDADADWIEEFLLNVMFDEFEVNVEDDSAFDVAETIVRLRKDCAEGNWDEVLSMKDKWDAKDRQKKHSLPNYVRGEDQDSETSGSDEEEHDEDVGDDKKIEEPKSEKLPKTTEVDEEGFTLVTKKKR
ncbi:Pre-rRNA-processing protein TSR2 [Erysiphe neolycopersici]|uniref:Pre-rRNA-processing protein TSR2 n=1 Tax=Erysiphe neolycopersici TaxID=212602 RepID=A0A420HVE0_9PEZI|nr:Pre-rRNA-processing protein TSR2 [Erysiphe neolycopersici]